MSFSSLQLMQVKEIALQIRVVLRAFLDIDTTCAIFQSLGIAPAFSDFWNIEVAQLKITGEEYTAILTMPFVSWNVVFVDSNTWVKQSRRLINYELW